MNCDACTGSGFQADGETPCPCRYDDLPRLVRDLNRELARAKQRKLLAEKRQSQAERKVRKETERANALGADCDRLSAELAEARKNLERAGILVRLLTVRQVIASGDDAIEAAGLSPWCMNEGLADGSERISPSFLASSKEDSQ